MNNLIAAFFELAGGRQDVPVVAKYIDGNLAAPGPNPPALTVVSVEAVKLPRGRARDNRRLAMLSNRVLRDLLLGWMGVGHRAVLRRPVTYSNASASGNCVASAVEYLGPTFGQPLMAGFFASPIGNVAIPRAAYFGCHFEKIPITNPLIKSGSNAHD